MVILLALAGLSVAAVIQRYTSIRLRDIADSAAYGKSITALLAVGLFASVYGISRTHLRSNARLVLAAITLGVTGKAFLTGGVMVLAYGSAGYLLLGVAVAQIDPLSVAASVHDYGMSQRAKSLLLAWASFDDPVTILLVAYLATTMLPAIGQQARSTLAVAGVGSYLTQFALNALLIAVAGLAWYLIAVRASPRSTGRRTALLCLILAGLIAFATSFGLLIGIAVCGLFYRPHVDRLLSWVVSFAFYAATFLLGLLLLMGVDVLAGLLLGATVFVVQLLAGTLIGRGLPRSDRLHLALGQQNGLTAVALALAIQPYFPAAVGIIAIAVLTVNTLHIIGNGILTASNSYSQPVAQKSLLRPKHSDLVPARDPAVTRQDTTVPPIPS